MPRQLTLQVYCDKCGHDFLVLTQTGEAAAKLSRADWRAADYCPKCRAEWTMKLKARPNE